MAYKKIYYETTEEVRTKTRKASITVDQDYTQVYNCFSLMSRNISNGMSYKLLFWLLANVVNKDRGFSIDSFIMERFNDFLKQDCEHCVISKRTFAGCVKELVLAGAIARIGRGHYYANAHGMWKGTSKARELFLQEEAKHNRYKMLNPSSPGEISSEDLY